MVSFVTTVFGCVRNMEGAVRAYRQNYVESYLGDKRGIANKFVSLHNEYSSHEGFIDIEGIKR